MIPVAWFSGHFRFSLIASGHQRLECFASAGAGLVTIGLSYAGVRLHGAAGAAVALLAGGVVNAVLAGIAMTRVIGPLELTSAVRPFVSCVVAGILGFVVTEFTDATIGAAVAVAFYGLWAASQWNVARLRLAWQGRLD